MNIKCLCCALHDDVIKWKHFPRYHWLLAICAGNSPVHGDEFPAQRPVTRSFDVFFDLRLNNNREAGDLTRYRAHYDVIVMVWTIWQFSVYTFLTITFQSHTYISRVAPTYLTPSTGIEMLTNKEGSLLTLKVSKRIMLQ